MFCSDRVNILLYLDVPSMIRCLHLKGICAHVDLMRFEDGIAIVSLESSCVMHFTQVGEVSDCDKEQPVLPMIKIPVFLMPGSLVLLFGDARYLWKHEINRKPGFQMWEGQEVNQKRRTSITLRKLCHAE
jgi:alkylated DNA repair dioxygenase AlkB